MPFRPAEVLIAEASGGHWPISPRHRDLMARRGLSAAAQCRLGLGSSEGGYSGRARPGILLPVADRDGGLATTRLLPDPDPFGTSPVDLGQFDPRGRELDIAGETRLVPTPFVAFPAERTVGPVLVTPHDLWAAVLSELTGQTVVSTFGGFLLERAIARAAELAQGHPLVLVPYLGVPLSRPAFRSAIALSGVFSNEVRVATRVGGSAEALSRALAASTRVVGRANGTRKVLTPGWRLLCETEGLNGLASHLAGKLVSAGIGEAARRWARRPPIQPSPDVEVANVVRDVQTAADRLGIELAAMGGAAIDLLVGPVRPRKDIDFAVFETGANPLGSLANELVSHGFRVTYCRSPGQVILQRGPLTLEFFRVFRGPDGACYFSTRTSFLRFPWEGCTQTVARGEYTLRVLAPAVLYYMKQIKLRTAMGSLLLRSQWVASYPDRCDLGALHSLVDPSLLRRRIRAGEFQQAQILPFRFRPFPRLVSRLRADRPAVPL